MTPLEKEALDSRARRAGLSTAEFVRRRVTADDFDEHSEEIEALLLALEASAPSILRAVNCAIANAQALMDGLETATVGTSP